MKKSKKKAPFSHSLTVGGREWGYAVDAVYVHVMGPSGNWKIGRSEFHRFPTITPADVKRFIQNGCQPVDYPLGGERELWQKIHDGMHQEAEDKRREKYNAKMPFVKKYDPICTHVRHQNPGLITPCPECRAQAEWQSKVESGEIFVDDEGRPLDPVDDFYPEHAKLERVKDQSQAIGEFLDWLLNERPKGALTLCERHPKNEVGDVWIPLNHSIEKLLAEYFEVDEARLESEKRAMLQASRRPKK